LKIDHILGHAASISKYKKIGKTTCILSDHNELKVKLNSKNNNRKYAKNWRLNNTLIKDQWVIEEIRGIKRFLEANENKNTIYQNLWDTTKAVLRGKFIPMSAYINRTGRSQINDIMLYLMLLETQE
jgi:hypothetical protein